MSKWQYIGKRLNRVDGVERVTGRAAFAADVSLPGMLYGKAVRSPYAHARIRRIDASKALALEGVKAVITGADFPSAKSMGTMARGEIIVNMKDLAKLVMAREKALFVGHTVAAVAATSPHVAEEAAKLVEVEYEELPPVLDIEAAMAPNAPLLHEDLFTQSMGEPATEPSNIGFRVDLGRGDVEAGFAEADVVLEGNYRTNMLHQGYIEPQAATALVDAAGRVTVWASSQGFFNVKAQVCRLLDIPFHTVRVIPTETGGGFGGKTYVNLEPLCVMLAKKAGRPVKMVMTRSEVFQATGPAAPAKIWMKVGAKRDGQITAVAAKMIYDGGAFPGAPAANGASVGLAPYRLPALAVESFDVVTNKPRVNAYRAPGMPQACYAVESMMDRMAEALGMDPVEFRLRNAAQEGDLLPNDVPHRLIGGREVLERAKEHPAWKAPLEGPNRGRGMAFAFWRGGTGTSSCHLMVNRDGSISLVLGSVDLTGTRTSMAQVAAEEFGMSPDMITVTVGDTETVAFSDISAGSRVTYTLSAAVHLACQDALAQLKQHAAGHFETSPEAIEYERGMFRLKGVEGKAISLPDLIRTGRVQPIVGHGSAPRLRGAPGVGVHIVDVEVDPETGKTKILRYTAIQDAGCAVNPTEVEGQMQGGAAQGVGWALTEEYIFDERGVLRNPNLLDYREPTAADLPFIDCDIVEVPAADGPYGVRIVAEVPIIPPPAAIANAIYRATGVRMHELPMTSERVFWALREKETKVGAPAAR